MTFFNQSDGAVFFRLLLAHLLTDFILQPSHWVSHKRKKQHLSHYLYIHGLGVAMSSTYLLLGKYSNPWPAIAVGITHTLIDWLKLRWDSQNRLRYFIFDQVTHLLVLIIVWFFVTENWDRFFDVIKDTFTDLQVVAILAGYLFCTTPLGILIGMATRKWRQQLTDETALNKAGIWIGITERTIIFSFILLDQYEAIGFLIAAKSLLRFKDDGHGANQAEYVLVGTLMSYTSAIAAGLIIKLVISP